MSELVNLFKKRKKQDDDSLEILRKAFLTSESEGGNVSTRVAMEKNDPQVTTITKTETVHIEQKEFPISVPSVEAEGEISEEDLNLIRKLLDVFRGKTEIGNRLKPLLNPENLQTTSRLSEVEVDFVTDCNWLANQWKVFEPLRDLANELCETVISEGGKGRQEAISFIGALTEGKLLKSLMVSAEMPKKSRFPLVGKKKEKETEGET